MNITQEHVEKALASLEEGLGVVSKASEDDLDQPEGADLGNPAKDKMSDHAKSKKALKAHVEPDGDEGEEEEDEEDEKKGMKMKKMAKKSFSDEMPEEIETKIDVSEFLKSLVGHTGEVIDGLRETVMKSDAAHESQYTELAKGLEDLQQSQAKIGVVLKGICQHIGMIAASPARAPRSDTVAKSAASERSFSSGLAPEGEESIFKGLSATPHIAKSQISEKLCDLVKKGEAEDLDVISFESSNYLRPDLVSKLKAAFN